MCIRDRLDSDGDGVMSDVDMCPMTHPSNAEYVDENGCWEEVEPVGGCLDESASNFDNNADFDDGSCEYADSDDDGSSETSGDEEDDDDKGRLPGFTLVVTLTAMMGALLLAGRRKV